MEEEIKFDKDLITKGQWTKEQLDLMNPLLEQIKKVMSERFPELVKQISLKCDFPTDSIGAKVTATLNVEEILYLGEMNQIHILEMFKDQPKGSEKHLKALFNDTVVLAYYQLMTKVIESSLSYVTKRADEEGMCDNGKFFVRKKKVIPLPFIPEDVVLMHPNTIKNLKRDSR
jgi:hypothetical protein